MSSPSSLLPLLLFLGCGSLDPELGAEQEGMLAPCSLSASSAPTPDFQSIKQQLFEPYCGCHVQAGGVGQLLGGLNLSSYESFNTGGKFLKSEQLHITEPCENEMLLKLLTPPPHGAQMPLNGKPLSTEEMQPLIDWLAAGAPQ